MGRLPKNAKIVITEDNQALADYFLSYVGEIYEEYREVFSGMLGQWSDDLFNDTIIKVYNGLRRNGLRRLNEDDPKEVRDTMLKNYLFVSAKLNYITHCKEESRRRGVFPSESDYYDVEDDAVHVKNKVRSEVRRDYIIMRMLDIVEDNFDPISMRCFKLYFLLKNMTYRKLKELTKVQNCKQRTVEVKKWLIDNVDEEELSREFDDKYDRGELGFTDWI